MGSRAAENPVGENRSGNNGYVHSGNDTSGKGSVAISIHDVHDDKTTRPEVGHPTGSGGKNWAKSRKNVDSVRKIKDTGKNEELGKIDDIGKIEDIGGKNSAGSDEQDGRITCLIIEDSSKAAKIKRPKFEMTREESNYIEDEDIEEEKDDENNGQFEIIERDSTEEESEPRRSNTYSAMKTVAQGMMDIALITANASQLRYAIELKNRMVIGLIGFSLVLQVGIGIVLIVKGRMKYRGKTDRPAKKTLNDLVVSGIFIITVVNILIASFTDIKSYN